MNRKKMAIITSYFSGETYGLLGPQMAATIIQEHTPYDCLVIALDRQDDKTKVKQILSDYFDKDRPVIGFSTHSGREDLFTLAGELKAEGALTILAGPQADVDFLGEKGWKDTAHRFAGLSKQFNCALWGPAEQAIPLLNNLENPDWHQTPGLLYVGKRGEVIQNPRQPWDEYFLSKVSWDQIYRVSEKGLTALPIATAQVVQQIGCPQAARAEWIEVDYPSFLSDSNRKKVRLSIKGCSFCDVAVDKGFHGLLGLETVLAQIQGMPELEDQRKIPFELINENPLPGLPLLLKHIQERQINLSQINLTLRADGLVKNKERLEQALGLARAMRVRLLAASIGFESFDDPILHNLHKGLDTQTNLEAIQVLRRFKRLFPYQWAYSRQEGAVHGLIHPTPWDTPESEEKMHKVIEDNSLEKDILPPHSIPLIIHHASFLGDWIREVETREKISFKRYVSTIGWWPEAIMNDQ
jgi:hypothetical protein